MAKDNLRYDNLREAMEEIQDLRSAEVGDHSWPDTVERYGLGALFIEVASITGRLEKMLWPVPDAPHMMNFNRAYDLLIDLGNYADFIYQAIREIEDKVSAERARKARSPLDYDLEDRAGDCS